MFSVDFSYGQPCISSFSLASPGGFPRRRGTFSGILSVDMAPGKDYNNGVINNGIMERK